MALPASGQISLSDIANELGIPLSNLDIGQLAADFNIPADPDSISEFYSLAAIDVDLDGPFTTTDNAGQKEGHLNCIRVEHNSPTTITVSFGYTLINGSLTSTITYYGTAGSGTIAIVTASSTSGTWTSPAFDYNETLVIGINHFKGAAPCYCQINSISASIVSGTQAIGTVTPTGNINFDKTS